MPATWIAVRDIPLAELTRFPGNPRRGNTDEIRGSIRRNGQYRSLVVRDGPDGLIILAGNHTRDALEAEGQETARCEIITCTDDEAIRINLADNRLSDMGAYDDRLLADLLTALDEDLSGTGFDERAVTEIMRTSGALADQATGFLNDFNDPSKWPGPPGDPLPPGPPQPGPPPLDTTPPPAPSGNGQAAPPAGEDTHRWVQVSWMVSTYQRDLIQRAVTTAKQNLGLPTSADAVTAIARAYLQPGEAQ